MQPVKIGLHSIAYNTNATLPAAFSAWREVKNGALKTLIGDLRIIVRAAAFPETVSLGYPLFSDDGTLQTLDSFAKEGLIDKFITLGSPTEEQILWSENVKDLQYYEPDILWMIGCDEAYEVKEIERVLKFILRNPLTDYFRVNFKNYFGRGKYVKDFIAPRIWSNVRNGGVDYHYKDDLVMYKNGKRDTECSCMTIPTSIAFPDHYSWSLPPEYSDEENKKYVTRKLGFQKLRYKLCSYRWNENKNELEFNPNYYKLYNLRMPEIYYE